GMIEVTIDSIRISLMSQHRVVILKEVDSERYLPIWIGPCEADAITIELQGIQIARPMTHDLLKALIAEMGAKVSHILVNDLRNETFYARIVLDVNGHGMELDSRPSDAIALAVRVRVPIFVDEDVMERAAIVPEENLAAEGGTPPPDEMAQGEPPSAFKDLLDGLDLDVLDG
ncbi:MAG: bifunctional nuclease family protein, partial [Thermoflexales bacterium]|nr:bifunctional nuclease family protein [Thermoflexales bacterium]